MPGPTERVEFVETDAPGGDDGHDLLTVGDPGHGGGRTGRWGAGVVGLAVLALVGALLAGRFAGGDTPAPKPSATARPGFVGRPSTPVTTPRVGLIGLPRGIDEPRQLVADATGDVVWMLDHGAGIVRIENGVVTARQLLESQVTTIAVSPDGERLYVATAASRPSIQVLDATTLAPGRSRPLTDGSVQALAVSTDAVWAASGSQLLRLDLGSLATLSTLTMPGVVVTSHLRITEDARGAGEAVVGLVTSGNDDGSSTTRFLDVDTGSEQVEFGRAFPDEVDIATTSYLTWVSYTPTPGGPLTTQGFETALDQTPAAQTPAALPAGTRIYDGGAGFAAFFSVAPHSSVLTCHDDGGFATSEVDVAPSLPGAVITGPLVRTDSAFYIATDRGLVREGAGDCP